MRVVLTRAASEADVWASGLRAAGHEVLLLPLIEIGPAPDPGAIKSCWKRRGEFHALMFVSSNAVAQFFGVVAATGGDAVMLLSPTPRAWATGPGTALALEARGWPREHIDAPPALATQFDSEALWTQVRGQITGKERVLIVRGSSTPAVLRATPGEGRDWLATKLAMAGAEVEFCVAYQRKLPSLAAAHLLQVRHWLEQNVVWLFSSSEALDNLMQILPDYPWLRQRALCTHPRIAARARDCGFGVVLESRPTLAEVVASIESSG